MAYLHFNNEKNHLKEGLMVEKEAVAVHRNCANLGY